MKPTLHEIAALPFPESLAAIRRHYDPLWGKLPEPDGEPRAFKIEMEWEVVERGTFVETVIARSEAEAKLLGDEAFERRYSSEYEVTASSVREKGQ